jgi:hypothetical protein
VSLRRLRLGEAVPTTAPRRFTTRDGYVLLRWRLAKGVYVEALEHRVVAGCISETVHHRNGQKQDNRPDNLEPMTRSQHASIHGKRKFDRASAASMYAVGTSVPVIAAYFGCNPVTVLRGLKKAGVQLRSISAGMLAPLATVQRNHRRHRGLEL